MAKKQVGHGAKPKSGAQNAHSNPYGAAKPTRQRKWARNTKDYTERQKAKWNDRKGPSTNTEDRITSSNPARSRRIRDMGQATPEGYMRTGGRYFSKVANMRTIRSLTTAEQRALFYGNKPKFLGVDGSGGLLRAAAEQGMYNGETSEANFRKSTTARKMIDADGGTYPPGHGTAGAAKKSRYIMAIGQDGHMR